MAGRQGDRSWPCSRYLVTALALVVLSPSHIDARDLFVAKLAVGDQSVDRGVSSIIDFAELFDDVTLGQLFSDYTPGSGLRALVDLRGVPAIVGYQAGTTTLELVIPQLFTVRFTGETRESAQEQLEAFLRGKSEVAGVSLTPLLQSWLAKSPVDPVAGNPNSLQTRMFLTDFDLATRPWTVAGEDWRTAENLILLEVGGGHAEGQVTRRGFKGGIDVNVVDLRAGYQLNFGGGMFGLNFDLPVTFTSSEGGDSYFASFGLGFQYRPTSWWTVQPAARVGAVGSIDLGALAALYSGTVTNYLAYGFDNGIGIGWGIEGGIAKTIEGIEIDNIKLEYDLTNTVLRNELNASGPVGVSLLGRGLGWRTFFADTRFFGDELFLEQYNEVGVAISLLNRNTEPARDWLSLNGRYEFGDDYNGFRLNVSSKF